MNPYILGITGKKGAGKETLARNIAEHLRAAKFTTEILPMAAYLKDTIAVMLNISREQLEDRAWKEAPCKIKGWGTNREVMQGIGQALRNSFRSSIWIDLWLQDYYVMTGSGNLIGPPDLIIIPDIRMDNEADMVESLGGVIVELKYGVFSDKKYETEDTDESEQGLTTHDIPIVFEDERAVDVFKKNLKWKLRERAQANTELLCSEQ